MKRLFQTFVETQLRKTQREHVEELLKLMEQQGYYKVDSTRHHKWEGGTLQHSLEVLLYALEHNTHGIPEDSIVVTCLLHDLCNVQKHIRRHGSLSVELAKSAGFPLSREEYLAIRWHMRKESEKGTHGKNFDEVIDSKLWQLLHKADGHSAAHPMHRQAIADKLISLLKKE